MKGDYIMSITFDMKETIRKCEDEIKQAKENLDTSEERDSLIEHIASLEREIAYQNHLLDRI